MMNSELTDIQSAIRDEMTRFRKAAHDRVQHLKLQSEEATDQDYSNKIDAGMLGIAFILRGIQDLNEVISNRLNSIDEKRAEISKLALALLDQTETLKGVITATPTSVDATQALLDAQDEMESALSVMLLMALVAANAVVAGDEDSTLLRLLSEGAKMIVESVADGVVPGVGFFVSAFAKVNEIRTMRKDQAKAANAVLADLNHLIASSGEWRKVHDELIASLA